MSIAELVNKTATYRDPWYTCWDRLSAVFSGKYQKLVAYTVDLACISAVHVRGACHINSDISRDHSTCVWNMEILHYVMIIISEPLSRGNKYRYFGSLQCMCWGFVLCCTTWWYIMWRHQMETFSMLLALCEGNPPVDGWFPLQRQCREALFSDAELYSLLSAPEQTVEQRIETPKIWDTSRSLWRHCYVSK